MAERIDLTVNGVRHRLDTDPERTLLEVLREDLDLTGTKYGCGEGECGACTVILNGRAVRSCLTSVKLARNREVRTIEGLARDGKLHPVQQAFIDHEAMQCGYCVPGMIMSTVALLEDIAQPNRGEIIEAMNGNVCRCCNYINLMAAIEQAAGLEPERKPS